VIIRAELLLEEEEIQSKMPLGLIQVHPSSTILMDILDFHSKSILRFGLLSSAWLIIQRCNLVKSQMNRLRCSDDA